MQKGIKTRYVIKSKGQFQRVAMEGFSETFELKSEGLEEQWEELLKVLSFSAEGTVHVKTRHKCVS